MKNLISRRVSSFALAISLAIGTGVLISKINDNSIKQARATAGDELTFIITQSKISNYPSSYSDNETTFTITAEGSTETMDFALAQHMKNGANMQSKANVGYFRNTSIPEGYAIKSVDFSVVSGQTARDWNVYGSDDVLTKQTYSSSTLVGTSKTSVALGSGSVYDSEHYQYTYLYAMRGANVEYCSSYTIKLVSLDSTQKTVKSISFSSTCDMNKKAYETSDSWDPTGLVVNAIYDDESSKPITSAVTFSYVPATPTIGQNVVVTASYTCADGTFTASKTITVTVTRSTKYTLISDASTLTSGTTFLLVSSGTLSGTTYTKTAKDLAGSSTHYFNSTDVTLTNGFQTGSTATASGATVFTLVGSQGNWQIKSGEKFLTFNGSANNSLNLIADGTDANTRFTISNNEDVDNSLVIESKTYAGRQFRYNLNNGTPRFSNYGNNQLPIYLFGILAESTYGTTDHISVTELPKTSDTHVGAKFNSDGLKVVAFDGEDETTANSKIVDVTLSLEEDYEFVEEDIGTKEITVTYTESEVPFTTTFGIDIFALATYKLVDSEPTSWEGSYLIVSKIETASTLVEAGTYAMKSTLANFDMVGNYSSVPAGDEIITGQEFEFLIEKNGTDGYSFKGKSDKYIGWANGSSNGIFSSDTPLKNTITWVNGKVEIVSTSGKKLKLNTTSGQYRYYDTGDVLLYKLVESSEASDYADLFLSTVTCDGDGHITTENIATEWSSLATVFNDLSKSDQELFRLGVASESGSNIQQALARYDAIVVKYNTQKVTVYEDFMGRIDAGMITLTKNFDLINFRSNENFIFILVSITVGLTIGGFAFLIRKKQK